MQLSPEAQPGLSLLAVEGAEVVGAEVPETVNTNIAFPICSQQFGKDQNHCWREKQADVMKGRGLCRALGLPCWLSAWWDIHRITE